MIAIRITMNYKLKVVKTSLVICKKGYNLSLVPGKQAHKPYMH